MWIIVDGYNLIRQWPELAMLDRADLQSGREALLRELAAYRRFKGHDITVVFDGRERGGSAESPARSAGIAVRYSQQGESADEVIGRLAREGRERAVVVSSDRAVMGESRRHGAACLSSAEFLDRIEAARFGAVKGAEGEDDVRPQKTGKGTAHRLPKAKRKMTRQLRGV